MKTNEILGCFEENTEQREDKKLRENCKDLWALAYDLMDDIVIIQDAEMRVLAANKAAHQLFQAKDGGLQGKHCHELFSGTSVPCQTFPLHSALRKGLNSSEIIEYQSLRKVFQVNSSIIPRQNGGETYFVHIARDITQYREAERAALQESEERFSKAFNANPAPMAISDVRSGCFIDVNQKWLEMLGYTKAELIGQTSLAVGIWENPEKRDLMVTELTTKGFLKEYPVTYKTKSGDTRSALRSAERITLRGQEVMLSLIYDFTERQRAENDLRASEERYRNILENIEDGYYEVTLTGTLIFCNDSMCRIFGYPKEELFGMSYRQFTVPEIFKQLIRTFRGVLRTGKPTKDFDWQILCKDGKIKDIEGSISLLKNSSGKPTGFRGIVRDVTERKEEEREKAKLQALLQQAQKMESVGKLAGGVAHDFNNMLGVILGYAEMALDRLDPKLPLAKDLIEIRNAASRSADITRQLLTFARKQPITPKVLDLNSTMEGMLKMLGRLIGENIVLDWRPGAALWPVKIDASQIDQIMANLCVNARDAIVGIGKIIIETRNSVIDDQYRNSNPEAKPGEYVQIVVADNGSGIPQEVLAYIFEPFFTTKAVGEGTGLGLATVYGIVKQNNGVITVASTPGAGTVLTISLPKFVGKMGLTLKKEEVESALFGHETILLVEDESKVLKVTKKMLQRLGYNVLAASTPSEAIRLVAQYDQQIDLLLTDVLMPEMNGRDLAEKVHSLYPQLNHLFMSGYTANIIDPEGILEEEMHFLQKPFSKKELAVKVRQALENKKKDK